MSITKQVSLHGRRAYISPEDILAGKGAVASGGDGQPAIVIPGASKYTAQFEDFLGDTGVVLPAGWKAVEGDTGAGSASGIQLGTGGVYRLYKTAGVATAGPTEGQALAGELQWKVDQGEGANAGDLRFSARVKLESVSRTSKRIHVFAGLTDQVGYEHPIYDTGAGVISNASNAVGFMFSPGGDTGWSAVAVDGDTDATPVALTSSITANTYDELEVHIHRNPGDTGSTATFYVNGIAQGSIDNPVNVSTALAPYVSAWQQDTGGEYADVDYVAVSALRDTGL